MMAGRQTETETEKRESETEAEAEREREREEQRGGLLVDRVRTASFAPSYSRLFATAARAIRANALPGAALNSFALTLLILYFVSPPVNAAFASLAAFKDTWGLAFSFFSTALVGGFIPWLFIAFTEHRKNQTLALLQQPRSKRVPSIYKEGLFLVLFWGEKGIEVDLFYQLQALIFGSQASAAVVIPKVLVDMFIYNPIWASHTILGAYFWKDANFSFAPVWEKFHSREYWSFIWPSSLIAVWIVWIPAVSIVYCLPSALQIPLFNITLCFWSILLVNITAIKS